MSVTAKKRTGATKPKSRSASAKSTRRTLKKKPAKTSETSNRPKVTTRKRTTKPCVGPPSEQVAETNVAASSLMAVQKIQPPIVCQDPVPKMSTEALVESFPPLAEDIVTLKTAPESADALYVPKSEAQEEKWVQPVVLQEQTRQSSVTDDQLLLSEETAFSPETKVQDAVPTPWTKFLSILLQAWQWAQTKFKSHQVKKRLRVCESVSLGEKRFIAVIQVDGEQFLVGGSSNSVSTLAHLDKPKEFPDIFRGYEQDLSRA